MRNSGSIVQSEDDPVSLRAVDPPLIAADWSIRQRGRSLGKSLPGFPSRPGALLRRMLTRRLAGDARARHPAGPRARARSALPRGQVGAGSGLGWRRPEGPGGRELDSGGRQIRGLKPHRAGSPAAESVRTGVSGAGRVPDPLIPGPRPSSPGRAQSCRHLGGGPRAACPSLCIVHWGGGGLPFPFLHPSFAFLLLATPTHRPTGPQTPGWLAPAWPSLEVPVTLLFLSLCTFLPCITSSDAAATVPSKLFPSPPTRRRVSYCMHPSASRQMTC